MLFQIPDLFDVFFDRPRPVAPSGGLQPTHLSRFVPFTHVKGLFFYWEWNSLIWSLHSEKLDQSFFLYIAQFGQEA